MESILHVQLVSQMNVFNDTHACMYIRTHTYKTHANTHIHIDIQEVTQSIYHQIFADSVLQHPYSHEFPQSNNDNAAYGTGIDFFHLRCNSSVKVRLVQYLGQNVAD